jgi:hypothetical protein
MLTELILEDQHIFQENLLITLTSLVIQEFLMKLHKLFWNLKDTTRIYNREININIMNNMGAIFNNKYKLMTRIIGSNSSTIYKNTTRIITTIYRSSNKF